MQLQLYRPGDELEIYQPGDIIDPSRKSWSLLFFKLDELNFPQASKALTTRLINNIKNKNLVFVGDSVVRTAQEMQTKEHKWDRYAIRRKSFAASENCLRDMGL